MVHLPNGKAVAEYPRTPDTQGQAAGDDYDFHAAVQHPDERADGVVPSVHRAQSTWPRLPQPNWEAVAAH